MRKGYCDFCGRTVYTGRGKVDRSNPLPKGHACRPCSKELAMPDVGARTGTRAKHLVYGFAAAVAVFIIAVSL